MKVDFFFFYYEYFSVLINGEQVEGSREKGRKDDLLQLLQQQQNLDFTSLCKLLLFRWLGGKAEQWLLMEDSSVCMRFILGTKNKVLPPFLLTHQNILICKLLHIIGLKG